MQKSFLRTAWIALECRTSLPVFLCPILANSTTRVGAGRNLPRARAPGSQSRYLHVETSPHRPDAPATKASIVASLPRNCPGCGAFSQTLDTEEAGYYSVTRKPVKAYLSGNCGDINLKREQESEAYRLAIQNAGEDVLKSLGIESDSAVEVEPEKAPPLVPICDRCHYLLHHHQGHSIIHPTLQSIEDIIADSPYKYNHIYHVIDAADFPLSLIPNLQHRLSLMAQRSKNRRSKSHKFYADRKSEMSFIITRSDLLAPRKEQVDALMPYLVRVLRDALGRTGEGVRLGNVRCVSSMRGWWTTALKEDIWKRGGGGWMVGKVNVGKSHLFESVFPKGRGQDVDYGTLEKEAALSGLNTRAESLMPGIKSPLRRRLDDANLLESEHSLLPPAPPEEPYPVMPIVSDLPGTTASPIRLPFGNGKGELIDLPGLSRGDLEECVLPEVKTKMVMKSRIKAAQCSIKPGQSLLIGDLIRITPTSSDDVLLACPFLTIKCHVTNTTRAIAIQKQEVSYPDIAIAKPGIGDTMASAGTFKLQWDVTKNRAGPLTSPKAIGLKPSILPFVIYSADILIEGCGWVELAVQVRKRTLEQSTSADEGDENFPYPEVEIFSPNGSHVGIRRPMNGWAIGGRKRKSSYARTSRPRVSMKGMKKSLKRAARLLQSRI